MEGFDGRERRKYRPDCSDLERSFGKFEVDRFEFECAKGKVGGFEKGTGLIL